MRIQEDASPPPHPAQTSSGTMSTSRSSRLPQPPYALSNNRDDGASQNTSTFRTGGFSNLWSTPLTTNRDAQPATRGSSVSHWPTDDTMSSESMARPSTSGHPRAADDPHWGYNGWSTAEAGPSTMRTSGASPSSRVRDSFLGGQDQQQYMYTMRNGVSRPASFLGDDTDYRAGFPPGLNGNLDGDLSRRQDPRQPGYAPSRDPSLPPSRGNGSPAMQDRYPFSGGHTPSNSVGLSRGALAGTVYSTAGPSKAAVSSRSYDLTSRGQQDDPNAALAAVSSLSLDDRSGSGANGTPLNPSPRGLNSGAPVQSWPSNGPKAARYVQDPTSLNGFPPMGQADPRHAAPNRGSGLERAPPSFIPGTGHYTPPRDGRSQRPASRDAAMPQANGQTPPLFYDPGRLNQAALAMYHQQILPAELAAGLHGYPLASSAQQPIFRGPGYQFSMKSFSPGGAPLFPSGRPHDPAAGMRSAVLEEFRNSKASAHRWDLKNVFGHIAEFSGDQHGSRFIQDKIASAPTDEKDRVFAEIEPNAIQLMMDVYGNYVVQKCFEHGQQLQKKALAAQMKPRIFELSTQMYGCRVVQKAFDHILVAQQIELAHELQPNLAQVIQHQHGNHVAQKIIDVLPRKELDFVMDCMRGRMAHFSAQQCACRVVQKMLHKGTDQDKNDIFNELYPEATNLASGQYGNYVTQALLEVATPEDRDRLIRLIIPLAISLSKQQSASNVVEKCIFYGNPEHRQQLRLKFTSPGEDGRPELVSMMMNQFANYTIQKMFKQLEPADQESFRADVQAAIDTMNRDERSSKHVSAVANVVGIPDPAAGAVTQGSSPAQ